MQARGTRYASWPTVNGERVLPETLALGLICTLDMLSTLVLVKLGLAVEANPLLAWTLEGTGITFVLVKTFSFAIPLLIIEQLRNRCPSFVVLALRAGVVGYILVYLIGSLQIHGLL